jgi:hypothetical protein
LCSSSEANVTVLPTCPTPAALISFILAPSD